tara:strand:- start:856 stop:1053 length:198 start_codon:yes stop_codon:yes gene_type:complete
VTSGDGEEQLQMAELLEPLPKDTKTNKIALITPLEMGTLKTKMKNFFLILIVLVAAQTLEIQNNR